MGRKAKPDSKALVHTLAQAAVQSRAPPDRSTSDDSKQTRQKSEPPPSQNRRTEVDAANVHLDAPKQRLSLLPAGLRFPWWAVLLLALYLLLQLGMTLEHPCGVLGAWAPLTRADVGKSYRAISACTHPDKLRSRSQHAVRRGELLFQRATKARDDLYDALRVSALLAESEGYDPMEVTCSTQLDGAISQWLLLPLQLAREAGARDMAESVLRFGFGLVTFEFGVTTTISLALVLLSLGRTLVAFLHFVFTTGPITAVGSVLAALVAAPLPTLFWLCATPALRVAVFINDDLLPAVRGAREPSAPNDADGSLDMNGHDSEDDEMNNSLEEAARETNGETGSAAADATTKPDDGTGASSTAPAISAVPALPSRASDAMAGLPKRNLRRRPRHASKAAEEEARKALLHGEGRGARFAASPCTDDEVSDEERVLTVSAVRDLLSRRPPPRARSAAAAAVQFDLLLAVTKPVIPLVCLVATGQVYNGLLFSMFTVQGLSYIPAIGYEALHLLALAAGLLHTLLSASKSALADKVGTEGLLQLQWSWSAHDVLAVANFIVLGATLSAAAAAGNEPPLCASFAAGLALRLLLYEALPDGASAPLSTLLRSHAIEVVGVDEVAVRARGGVGGCAGGPLRATLGPWGLAAAAPAVATAAKLALLCLPLLATLQWAARTLSLARWLHRRRAPRGRGGRERLDAQRAPQRRRLAMSALLCVAMALLVAFFATLELNAVNGSLGNLLTVAVAGCVFESLLSTYDVRGRLRQFVSFVSFILL